jgi:hypothetical protein
MVSRALGKEIPFHLFQDILKDQLKTTDERIGKFLHK